jgi:uncharacterized protein YcsI (UPF0317 family)
MREVPVTSIPADPPGIRAAIRAGTWRGPTSGVAPGYAQANLVVVRRDWAAEFRTFCTRNPKPCPLLDVTPAGTPRPSRLAPNADLRTDIAGYRVYTNALPLTVADLRSSWTDDCVGFLLGCSFSFERALIAAGIRMRHVDGGTTVPMYRTTVDCVPTARLHGPLVVSMRPVPQDRVSDVRRICGDYPGAHGAPVHVGEPAAIGISDLRRPDYGDPVAIRPDEVPAFWACGVTPQVVLAESGCPWFASHEPGRMFVSDADERIAPLER